MNKELEKIIKNNPLSLGSVQLSSKESIKYINSNLSLNAQEMLFNIYQNALKNANPEEVAQAIKTYSRIDGNTFASAVYNLIQSATDSHPQFTLDDGSKVYRPLTFKENMVARIENNDLFNHYIDSCTGVAYKANSSLIKLNPLSKELITIPKDFDESYVSIIYNSFEGEELDIEKTSKQDKWLIAMGGINGENKEIYKDYQNTLSKRTIVEKENLMNFYNLNIPSKDQLRALGVGDGLGVGGSSDAFGRSSDGLACLLRAD